MKTIKTKSYSEYKKLIETYRRSRRLVNYTSYVNELNQTIYIVEVE
jgi:hypothetical protein